MDEMIGIYTPPRPPLAAALIELSKDKTCGYKACSFERGRRADRSNIPAVGIARGRRLIILFKDRYQHSGLGATTPIDRLPIIW
jgi:hypothetical protein